MKKRWILIGLISLFGYNICDQLDKPKEQKSITFEKVITVKSKTKPKVKIKVKKDIDYWINKHSKTYNLNPKLVKAVIKFESNMNPKARNPKSSSAGFGQFVIASGRWVYKELGYKNYNHYKTPPHIQIEMCCWYLHFLHKQYKGNTKKALMAYNGFELGDLYWKKVYKIKNSL
jgi:soluble lytic murein transglycosylase-like protein